MDYQKFQNKNVKKIFDSYPVKIRDRLLRIRQHIFKTADNSEHIGEIEETLKWGNPSYLTHRPKSGTTIRLAKMRDCEDKYAISVHCQTSLISDFKAIYPSLEYEGNRSIILSVKNDQHTELVQHFIFSALTYHQRKNRGYS